jgi:ribonucleoside-diphosphate reductase alpha chain
MKTRAPLKDRPPLPLQTASAAIAQAKYFQPGEDLDGLRRRLAHALARPEADPGRWEESFYRTLHYAFPGGRIMANAGAEDLKPGVSTINCTVSRTIDDSMAGIMRAASEAALTLKAGCVAPQTTVITEKGRVTAQVAFLERHQQILSYSRDRRQFEMRRIERHLVTYVPRAENIELVSGTAKLKTSVKHPVLVYRQGALTYVRADQTEPGDGLVHHALAWRADPRRAEEAWFAGAHLGDGSAYPKRFEYKASRRRWAQRAHQAGQRLIFKIRAAEQEVVERYARFFQVRFGAGAKVVPQLTTHGTAVWDYTVASFAASAAAVLVDHQIGDKSATLRVPAWIAIDPQSHFLPFLAGLIDTDGTVGERGAVSIAMKSVEFALQLQELLGQFGVHGSVVQRKPRDHVHAGKLIRDAGGAVIKICDSAFLGAMSDYMADGAKRRRARERASQAGQYDRYLMPIELRAALVSERAAVDRRERLTLGFYHGYHLRAKVSRVWLDRWERRFPHLRDLICFARTLRPIDAIRRNLPIGETFYDFTVDDNSNYLAGEGGLVVIHNCGIGYDFSTLRPRGALVTGAGATTSGPLPFMDVFDAICRTVSSAGGRRGAQMGCLDIGHPDIEAFITAKRETGRLRAFNLSCLVNDEFIAAVRTDSDWPLAFPAFASEMDGPLVWRRWPLRQSDYTVNERGQTACRVYRTVRARTLWNLVLRSTYEYSDPGFILIDEVNRMNPLWFCEDIRAMNPCGEQPLPPFGACLLGSVNLASLVQRPFTREARFDFDTYAEVVRVFARMLDNVVELHGLPLPEQRAEIARKRRHGMGYFGLGSALTMLGLRYGSGESVAFTERVTRLLAVENWRAALELAREKGPAPALAEDFEITPELLASQPALARDGIRAGAKLPGRVLHTRYSTYMQRIAEVEPELVAQLADVGARYTHATSIAPTGTMAASVGNNASNGIEPSFAHHYTRNMIVPGEKAKRAVRMDSYELLAYRHHVDAKVDTEQLPEVFAATAAGTEPREHIAVQAAAQRWVDASISKTINVPTDIAFAEFESLYDQAIEQQLKGCTTFRFNPEVHQGVLVTDRDLAATEYEFRLADGRTLRLPGDAKVEYEGGTYSAANLYDALKEGFYGKL